MAPTDTKQPLRGNRTFHSLASTKQVEVLKYLTENWGKVSYRDIEKQFRLKRGVANIIAGKLRKQGIELARLKSTQSSVFANPTVLNELKDIYKRSHS